MSGFLSFVPHTNVPNTPFNQQDVRSGGNIRVEFGRQTLSRAAREYPGYFTSLCMSRLFLSLL